MIGRKRWGLRVLAAAVLAVPATPGLAVTAAAGPAAPASGPPTASTGSDPAPRLVVPGSGKEVALFTSLKPTGPRSLPGSEKTVGNALDPAAAAAAGPRLKKAESRAARPRPRSAEGALLAPSYACDEYIDKTTQVGRDPSGAQLLQVQYYGDVQCNFYLVEAAGATGVIDRTPGFDGQVLSVGNQFHFYWDYYGYSTGGFQLNGDVDRRARSIEVVDEVYLLSDVPWGACEPLPNLRYLACDGLGTTLLHVVVGTGPFSTGLQDPPPLFVGAGQGPGCPLTVSSTLKTSRDTLNRGEHLAEVGFKGTIACSTGIAGSSVTGTSRAKLVDVPPSGNTGRDLGQEGADSGAGGESTGSVSLREGEEGGRRVRVVYTGQSVAPAGRAWGGCTNAPDGTFSFVQCNRNGTVVDWVAVGPVVDTTLPPEQHCRVAFEEFRWDTIELELLAKGAASCDNPLDSIKATVNVEGSYTENGQEKHVPLIFGGEAEGFDGDNDGKAEALYVSDCRPSQQTVTYQMTVKGTFQHPNDPDGTSGWLQMVGPTEPIPLGEACMPAT